MTTTQQHTQQGPKHFDMPAGRFEEMVSLTPDGTDTVLYRFHMPAGRQIPVHSHKDPEYFYVLSGTLEAFVLDETPGWTLLKAGEHIAMLDGIRHCVRNLSDSPAEIILVTNERMAEFFREAGKPCEAGAPLERPALADIQRAIKVADSYGYWNSTPAESAAMTA